MTQVQCAKQVFNSFVRLFQLFKLYPQGSPTRKQAIAKLHSELISFLEQFGFLGFEIQKKAVFYQGEVIYEQSGKTGDCFYTLYQEGIQWLEFLEGISPDEVEQLFEILDEYSRPSSPDSEDHLITRLLDAQLPNMLFQDLEEEDLLPELEQGLEKLNFLKKKTIPEICAYLLDLPEDPDFLCNPCEIDSGAQVLTHEEEFQLQKMKKDEESQSPIPDIFAALAHVCGVPNESDLLSRILALLRDGVSHALDLHDIDRAYRMVMTFRQLCKLCGRDHWAFELLEHNIGEIHKSESLLNLIVAIENDENFRLEDLKKFLLALNPEAIHTILPILLQVWSPALRAVLMESISALAPSGLKQLKELRENSSESLIFLIIELLGNMKTQEAAEILLGYLDHHSERVVALALETLMGMESWFPQQVFQLIRHDREDIQAIALQYLGSRKCEIAERLLISHLASGSIKTRKTKKTLALQFYRALGGCGSLPAYNFFLNIVLNIKWYRRGFRSVETEGAALGLHVLGTEEAMKVLDKAGLRSV